MLGVECAACCRRRLGIARARRTLKVCVWLCGEGWRVELSACYIHGGGGGGRSARDEGASFFGLKRLLEFEPTAI
jgi:hypothetical protein